MLFDDGAKLFVHGGMDSNTSLSRDAFMLDMISKQWSNVSMNNTNHECGIENFYEETQCAFFNDVIVTLIGTSCTATFDPKTKVWTIVPNDGRTTAGHGKLVLYQNQKRLLYVGGINSRDETLSSVQEFTAGKMWKSWLDFELPLSFSGVNETVIPISDDFCPFINATAQAIF